MKKFDLEAKAHSKTKIVKDISNKKGVKKCGKKFNLLQKQETLHSEVIIFKNKNLVQLIPFRRVWKILFYHWTRVKCLYGLENCKTRGLGFFFNFVFYQSELVDPVVDGGVVQKTAWGRETSTLWFQFR